MAVRRWWFSKDYSESEDNTVRCTGVETGLQMAVVRRWCSCGSDGSSQPYSLSLPRPLSQRGLLLPTRGQHRTVGGV